MDWVAELGGYQMTKNMGESFPATIGTDKCQRTLEEIYNETTVPKEKIKDFHFMSKEDLHREAIARI